MSIAFELVLVAALYASGGQAGGTGYIAVMGLAGFRPAVIKPTALALNVLVSIMGPSTSPSGCPSWGRERA